MNELWVKTNKFILNNSEKAPSSQGGAVIGIWWTLWIISSFAGNYTKNYF